MYNGKLYSKNKSGYWICSTGSRKRLHVAIWEHEWKREVPQGCIIHHLDWNKSNNNIENLLCVTVWEHEMIHNGEKRGYGKEYGYKLAEMRRVCGVPGELINDLWKYDMNE